MYAELCDAARQVGEMMFAYDLPETWPGATPGLHAAVLQIACEDVLAASQGQVGTGRGYLARQVIGHLVKRKLVAPPERMAPILDICTALGGAWAHALPLPSLLRLVSAPPTPAEVDALHRLQFAMEQTPSTSSARIVQRIDEILAGGRRDLVPGGAWSARVVNDLSTFDENAQKAWRDLLLHLLAVGDTAPSRRWTDRLTAHLDAVGQSRFLPQALTWLANGLLPDRVSNQQMPGRDADYLKGFVWALSRFEQPEVAQALADLSERCLRKVPNKGPVAARVGNACIRVLAGLGGFEPIAQLGRLRTRVKYAVGIQLIETALSDAAARAGLTPDELEEIAVPTFGLDRHGRQARALGEYIAEIRVTEIDDVHLSWRVSGGAQRSAVPAAVRQEHAAELRQAKRTAKEILASLSAQSVRLERLLESDRLIPYERWRERYVDHPLIGLMARRLVWQFSSDVKHGSGICDERGHVLDENAGPIDWLLPSTNVSLWHPLAAPVDAVLAWRRRLGTLGIVQPFKQAHRETYVLTEMERITEWHSNRFAAHILRQHQFAALCRERGWQYRLRGEWDSDNTPVRALPRWGLEIQLLVESPADRKGLPHSGVFEFIGTDGVRFRRAGRPVRLADVPALAFSEAMRDVDLFVGVCSVGNDPTWGSRDPDAFTGYWQRYSTGALSETAKTRHAVLAGLLPTLDVAGRLSLDERFLAVRGDLAMYRIHLGSGNVQVEPGSRHLCIVPPRRERHESRLDIRLPFKGDSVLAGILRTARLLAADSTITDPFFLEQLRLE